VNLEWLDLSFNLIEKIEGLEKLTKLSDLSLFSNNISKLQGLETLKQLNVLSVGSNKITDYQEGIQYLYKLQFPKLQVLKMADNPFYKTKEAEFKMYALAFLRKLKYLDYELIVEEDRATATEKHREEFNEQESQKNQDAQTEEQEKQMDPLLKSAKIDCTVGMIARIVREHKESKTLSYFPKYHEVFQPHDVQIEEFTQKFHHDMKLRNKEKTNTILYCEKVLNDSERQAEHESIALIDKFTSYRKHKFRELQNVKDPDHFDYNGFKKELYSQIDKLEDGLMEVELKLQESLQVATTNFTERIKKVLEEMRNKT